MSSPSTPTLNPHDNMRRKPRIIALFFDSTGKFSLSNSNVFKLYTLLDHENNEDQVCYYHFGAGAREFKPSLLRPFTRWADPVLDQAFAWYLSEQVLGGYRFLMRTYNDRAKICLFGFSRGAYAARALAGMLHKVGLLPKGSTEEKISNAYGYFKSTGSVNEILAKAFKEEHCRNVPVDFIGVWDTITSMGLIVPPSLPPASVEVNTTTRVFRQALSLDEHRARFHPDLAYYPDQPSNSCVMRHGMDGIFETDIKEVWFPGSHSDVGGGATLDTAAYAMSNVSLRWMIEQIVTANCNIIFDFDAFDRWHIPRAIGQPNYISPSEGQGVPASEDGPGGDIDMQDAIQGITDELWKNPLWWIFEVFPSTYIYQHGTGKWVTTWWLHLGRGRLVPPEPLFHMSVKTRMDKLNYRPKAHYKKGTEKYVS